MHVPDHFAERRVHVMHALIAAHPLAALVRQGREGLEADHVPVELDPEAGPFGTLRGHVARANPLAECADGLEVLAIFQGPQAYVTPSWYPSKRETGQVVPTWNYAVVHASGALRIVRDAAWLRALVERLTHRHEARQPAPWEVGDAPEPYVERMVKGIVGFEIPIARLQGKWKMSQNRLEHDRRGVLGGLAESESPADRDVAEIMRMAGRRGD
jgi:transcriptional regulator